MQIWRTEWTTADGVDHVFETEDFDQANKATRKMPADATNVTVTVPAGKFEKLPKWFIDLPKS